MGWNSKRRARDVGVSIFVTFITFGCDGGSSDDAGLADAGDAGVALDAPDETVTLRVGSWWASPSETEALQTVLDTYTEETGNPIEFLRTEQDLGMRVDQPAGAAQE